MEQNLMKKVFDTKREIFIEKARQIHKNKYDYSKAIFKMGIDKIIIICHIHGEFIQTKSTHLSCRIPCPQCDPRSRRGFIKHPKKIKKIKLEPDKIENGIKYWKRKCPDCNNIRWYDLLSKLNIDNKKQILCFRCSSIKKRKYQCHDIPWKKICQKCDKEITLKTLKGFISTKPFICSNCRKNPLIRNCPSCDKIIHYKSGSSCNNANKNNRKCLDCCRDSNVSKGEIEFLNYFDISNRQKFVGRYCVDGIKDNIIYEFFGDYFHGNPYFYRSDRINKTTKTTFGHLYEQTMFRLNQLKHNGYKIKYIWERDWNRFKKGKDINPNIIDF